MKKILFIFITILFFGCSVITPENDDKKIFDSFIGVSYLNIKNTLGLPTHNSYMDGETNWQMSYNRKSMHYSLNRDWNERNSPIIISTATRSFEMFTYYENVIFIMRGDYCVDWQASK
jgi:hypothetical protein